MTDFETILVERRRGVGWIFLNRPEALNALNSQLMHHVVAAAEEFDADDTIGAIVLTGSDRAFAAGADIKEMQSKSGQEMLTHFGGWTRFAAVRTPVIAAVSGYALGGGCELAMLCDLIVASDTARFGQPEVNLAVIPGLGGTQRLLRAVGYYRAADLVLTGRTITADEAERAGLVSRVVAADALLTEVQQIAELIASKSQPSVQAAKAALDAAMETPLAEGLRFETVAFASIFDLHDRAEGMAAFVERRKPDFTNR